ncbi:hypothetical protein, partial [Pseudomonas fluorescens]|uniref:hypothetical protein n=1 Tax=Pseudomonas fluorescens TaxID=294 RepID=UPI001F3950CC
TGSHSSQLNQRSAFSVALCGMQRSKLQLAYSRGSCRCCSTLQAAVPYSASVAAQVMKIAQYLLVLMFMVFDL